MTTRLSHRIGSLERLHAVARENSICSLCGKGPSTAFDGDRFVPMRVTFAGDGDKTPTHCPGCGRQQVFKLEFDKLGDE